MTRSDAWRMLQRFARDAGIPTAVCNHTFRATGITTYLDNGGSLKNAPNVPRPQESTHHQPLPSHRQPITLDEVEKSGI